MENMALTAATTLALLIEYFTFSLLVGAARRKTGIKAPATSGDSFSVESKGGVIQGQRVGSKLTITLESDIDTVVIQPYEG